MKKKNNPNTRLQYTIVSMCAVIQHYSVFTEALKSRTGQSGHGDNHQTSHMSPGR